MNIILRKKHAYLNGIHELLPNPHLLSATLLLTFNFCFSGVENENIELVFILHQ